MQTSVCLRNFIATASLCFFAGCATPSQTSSTASAQNKLAFSNDKAFPILEKGMTAATVRQKLGEPAEIKSMDAPAGKAEIWVYHIESTVGMTQVATGTKDVPVYTVTVAGGAVVMAQEPTYTTVAQKSAVTLSLLMFNDQLTAQKAAVEHASDYNN